jgi:hypothetical protein
MASCMLHRPVHVAAVEDAPPEDDVAVALLGVLGVDHVVLERRERAEGLDRRAGLEGAAHRLVEHGAQGIGL